MVGQQIKLAEQ